MILIVVISLIHEKSWSSSVRDIWCMFNILKFDLICIKRVIFVGFKLKVGHTTDWIFTICPIFVLLNV